MFAAPYPYYDGRGATIHTMFTRELYSPTRFSLLDILVLASTACAGRMGRQPVLGSLLDGHVLGAQFTRE